MPHREMAVEGRDPMNLKLTRLPLRAASMVTHWLPALLPTLAALALSPRAAHAQAEPTPAPQDQAAPKSTAVNQPLLPYELGLQATLIDQNMFKFHSPYEGPHSFLSRNENEKSDTYTLYMGVRLTQGFEAYLNPEMARGNGLSRTFGLAGFTNGDVIRNPDLGQEPYLARYMVRYIVSTGHGQEKVEASENQIEGMRPAHRLVLTFGKFAITDIFDVNSYANSTRTQFMNWALINNAAYDYAADTRGYTQGVTLEWVHPDWAVRFGMAQMPTEANGPNLSGDLIHSRGDQVELELHPHVLRKTGPLITRLLAYRNFARMGDYQAALNLAQQTGTTPDITATRQRGNTKYGFGLNFEQPLGDDGATALFGRYGWDDGATESFAYTECDRTFCLGGQLSGARWHRPNDHLSLAVVQNDLSSVHKEYLAAGGIGFLLGDGKLNYGSEQIVETYYSCQLAKPLTLSLDYQFINNPGYNRDRGPASVVSVRAHLEF
jgi:high affinity Mn2+ porin